MLTPSFGEYSWGGQPHYGFAGGMPPMKMLTVKPEGHWRDVMSLPEAREELGVYGDDSQDGLIKAKLAEAIGWVESLRGIGLPLSRTNVTCYYRDLADRLLLTRPAPDYPSASYSDLALTIARQGGDEAVADSAYALDVTGARPAVIIGDPQALRATPYKEQVENPVMLTYLATPETGSSDWELCRGVVKEALNMAYASRESMEASRGFMTILARKMPNRVVFA